MDATNAELYKLAMADAPYVIAAYGILWAALIGYVSMVLRRAMRLEKEIAVLEESVARRGAAE
ncbi:MAG: heme exporter protein CcmD [Actinomycetota bacterium]|nr:heme exporter protein CcmD [Actinomycetota bacterium]